MDEGVGQDSETRRRLPPTKCRNRESTLFNCAGGDKCCKGACVGMDDRCCINVNGDGFPCGGRGGGCCGNACFAPGSKCCVSHFKPKERWYPVTKDSKCASGFYGTTNPMSYPSKKWSVLETADDDADDTDATGPVALVTADSEAEGRDERVGQDSETRRRLPPTKCRNREGTRFNCARGDKCCKGACVGMGNHCCINVKGDGFPCGGRSGGCCGNACFAPGSKCCISHFKPTERWYPVTKATKCASGFYGTTNPMAHPPTGWTGWSALETADEDAEDLNVTGPAALITADVDVEVEDTDERVEQDSETRRRLPPAKCRNQEGTRFNCAGGDSCCKGACVGRGDRCCINVNGDGFPCQGGGGGCCGNACFAPGSKCCVSPFKPKERWYPVTKATKCSSGFYGTTNPMAHPPTGW